MQRAYELILDAAGEGICGLDKEGRATFVNRVATEILGWRPEDVVPLATHLLGQVCAELGRPALRLTRQQAETLMRHDWPGNIRELRNVMERAVILSAGDRLRLDLVLPGGSPGLDPDRPPGQEGEFMTDLELRQLERTNLIAALRHAAWRVWGEGGAAELLGVKPSTLSYRMKALGIRKGG